MLILSHITVHEILLSPKNVYQIELEQNQVWNDQNGWLKDSQLSCWGVSPSTHSHWSWLDCMKIYVMLNIHTLNIQIFKFKLGISLVYFSRKKNIKDPEHPYHPSLDLSFFFWLEVAVVFWEVCHYEGSGDCHVMNDAHEYLASLQMRLNQ